MPPQTKKRKTDRWRELKREAMLDAALVRITAEGPDGFTVEGVAEQAGVAKGTIYLYFASKQQLVAEAIAHALDPLVEEVVGLLGSDAGLEERLRGMARANFAFFDDQRELFRAHLTGPYFPQTQTGRLHERGYRTVLQHTTRCFEAAMEAGAFRRFDPGLAASVWLESLTAFILRRLRDDDWTPVAEEAETLLALFLHGIAVPAD